MTATDATDKVDLDEAVDINADVPCFESQCDENGTWLVQSPCGCSEIYCALHRFLQMQLIDSSSFCKCARCDTRCLTSSVTWRRL